MKLEVHVSVDFLASTAIKSKQNKATRMQIIDAIYL